jgi:hypothetical protein
MIWLGIRQFSHIIPINLAVTTLVSGVGTPSHDLSMLVHVGTKILNLWAPRLRGFCDRIST